MSRGITGHTQPAWTILEDRSEWDHFRQCEQPPDTGHSYMILKLSFRNSSVPSAPKFCTTCPYCQGSDRILHLIQLEKLLPQRHQWAKKKKKNPQIPLSGKLSEGWGVSFQSVQPETQPSTSRHLCALALQLLQIGLILLIWLCIKYYCWTMFAVISDRTEHF